MVTPVESKALLTLLVDDAEDTARWMLRRTTGPWKARRLQMLDTVPDVASYYSDAAAALGADLYNSRRVGVSGAFAATPIVLDRTVRIRRGIAWASLPLELHDVEAAGDRFAELIRSETTRPYRDTILGNGKRDGQYVGWTRITRPGSCGFCRALADRGAVYKKDTAIFAAHNNCLCTAAPVFVGQPHGPEASVEAYTASKRRRTAEENARTRAWAAGYEDEYNPRKHIAIS